MNNIDIITQWLTDSKRDYQQGIAIFETFATPKNKQQYSLFLQQQKEPDIALSVLINQLAHIRNLMLMYPDKYTQQVITLSDNTEEIREKSEQINALQEQMETLNDNQVEEIENIRNEIDDLKQEIETLKASQITRVVPFDNLPPNLQKAYQENQRITPLLAQLHTQLDSEKLTTIQRGKIIDKILKLDDTRRQNWDLLDSFQEGKLPEEIQDTRQTITYSTDDIIAGSQMQKRLERLSQNITRTKETIETTDRQTIKDNAEKRLTAYQAEHEKLTQMLKKEKK